MAGSNVISILQLGITGLVFLFALMVYMLLRSEAMRAGRVRPQLLAYIQRFTYFSFAMAALVAIAKPLELATPRLIELMGVTARTDSDAKYCLDQRMLFGEVNGQPRARLVSRSESDKLLSQRFGAAKRSIRIVTQTGATWLTADQEPNLRGAVKRDIQVTILLHDFRNQNILDAIQKSALMSNLPVNEPAHYVENSTFLPNTILWEANFMLAFIDSILGYASRSSTTPLCHSFLPRC